MALPEPLLDFKGHMQNLIGEIRQITTYLLKIEVEEININLH